MESTYTLQRMFGRAYVNQLDTDEPYFVIVDPLYWQYAAFQRPNTPKELVQCVLGLVQTSDQCYVVRASAIQYWLMLPGMDCLCKEAASMINVLFDMLVHDGVLECIG